MKDNLNKGVNMEYKIKLEIDVDGENILDDYSYIREEVDNIFRLLQRGVK